MNINLTKANFTRMAGIQMKNLTGDPKAWLECPKTRRRAMWLIWIFDTLRFLILFPVFGNYGINPCIFFCLDVVTVPGFVNGWACLIGSLIDSNQKLGSVVRCIVFTFFMSTAPYLYAAWAGRQVLPNQAWIILSLVIVFPLIKINRMIFRYLKETPGTPLQ